MADNPAAVLAGLIAEATEGPWRVSESAHRGRIVAEVPSEVDPQYVMSSAPRAFAQADAALIVHLVNLAPTVVDLIAAAEALRASLPDHWHDEATVDLEDALAALTVTPAGDGPGPS